MFKGIASKLTTSVVTNVLRGIASDPDTRTTAVGTALAFVIGAHVDFGALVFKHDMTQAVTLAAAVLTWALGILTNKHPEMAKYVDQLIRRVEELETQIPADKDFKALQTPAK